MSVGEKLRSVRELSLFSSYIINKTIKIKHFTDFFAVLAGF